MFQVTLQCCNESAQSIKEQYMNSVWAVGWTVLLGSHDDVCREGQHSVEESDSLGVVAVTQPGCP